MDTVPYAQGAGGAASSSAAASSDDGASDASSSDAGVREINGITVVGSVEVPDGDWTLDFHARFHLELDSRGKMITTNDPAGGEGGGSAPAAVVLDGDVRGALPCGEGDNVTASLTLDLNLRGVTVADAVVAARWICGNRASTAPERTTRASFAIFTRAADTSLPRNAASSPSMASAASRAIECTSSRRMNISDMRC